MSNKYRRRSINLDDTSHARCRTLAADKALSISGMLRLIIKEAYDDFANAGAGGQSVLLTD
jgi:hypothetical protein